MGDFDFTGKNEIYYKVNGEKYYSKIEAMENASAIDDIEFVFYDSVWKKLDWTKEPSESWDSLMRQRCLQIRNKYRHVSLLYTGGYDSHTILTTFVKNKIRLDSIVLYVKDYFDAYYDLGPAYQFAKQIQKHEQPWLEIKECPLTYKQIEKIYENEKTDWIYKSNRHSLISKAQTWYLLEKYSDQVHHINKQNGVVLWGREKPYLDLHDGKFFARIHDRQSWEYLHTQNMEPFYLSYDFPELYLKNCWMSLRFFQKMKGLDNKKLHMIQGNRITGPTYREYNLALGRECLQHDMALYKWYTVDYDDTIQVDRSHNRYAKETVELKKYFSRHNKKIDEYHENGKQYIKQKFPEIPTLMGHKYFMCKSKNQTTDIDK